MKQSRNKWTAWVLIAVLLLQMVPSVNHVWTARAAEADVVITSPEQLQAFAADVNGGNSYEGKTVRLDVNIALEGEENPWTPIGTSASPFKGTFDGNGHVVSELYIGSGSAVGFFGMVNGGTVENLTIKGCGSASGNADVTGTSNIAGVVGKLTSGTVRNCGNNTNVSGDSAVGGIVGAFSGACTVSGCYNTGEISGTTGYIGGIVGQGANSSIVENSYNAGKISGPATVGGVIGGHKAYSTNLANCFHAGQVTDTAGASNNIGAVAGATKGTIDNCYYLTGTGADTKTGVSEVSSLSADALGGAFTDGASYPVLAWEHTVSTETPLRPSFTENTELSAQLAGYIRAAVASAKAHAGIGEEDSLLGDDGFLAGVSSTDTDWMALAMGRFGYFKPNGNYSYMIDDGSGYADYLDTLKAYIEITYQENSGILHSVKATEWHRAAVAIAALSGDPQSFGVYDGAPIDLIADGSYDCVLDRGPGAQGINGWIWGLIALDLGAYEIPETARYTRERFITEILKMQLTDGVNGNEYGGWVLGGYGSSSDVDITAMAIQALAPYYNDDIIYTYKNENSKEEVSKTVRQCVDEALDRLGAMMDDNAGFSSWNTNNVEGVSQVIVALTALGINPAEDSRFITSKGETLLDGLLKFRLSDGGYCHVLNGGWSSMANDQAAYALVSYWRLENGMRALYDMRENWTEAEKNAIDAATRVIAMLPESSADNYKAQLKAALQSFRAVPASERRYVYNYARLAAAIELVGGEEALDTDDPYIIRMEVTKDPDKVEYVEGELFDPAGMVVTLVYSDGTTKAVSDYRISLTESLKPEDDTVYITYSLLKAAVTIVVHEKMPWEGEGTQESPYLITTAEDLEALAERVNGGKTFSGNVFVMDNHIDFSDIDDWTPIGTSRVSFDGVFDGQGYAIDNLFSTRGGLFGYAGENAVIRNVGVASGEITAGNSFVGGIVGWSNGADVINCWNGADISCGGYSGGLVGTVRSGGESLIQGCYNAGTVSGNGGSTAISGIVGHLAAAVSVTIENCYNAGAISGNDRIGGIVGTAQGTQQIQNCYNIGVVNAASGEECGPIAGWVSTSQKISNCYYNLEEYAAGIGYGADTTTGKTSDEMKSAEFLAQLGEAFKEDTDGLLNQGYPLLYWQKTEEEDDPSEPAEPGNPSNASEEDPSKPAESESPSAPGNPEKPSGFPGDGEGSLATPSDSGTNASSDGNTEKNPNTGDVSLILPYVALLLAAVAIVFFERRKRTER